MLPETTSHEPPHAHESALGAQLAETLDKALLLGRGDAHENDVGFSLLNLGYHGVELVVAEVAVTVAREDHIGIPLGQYLGVSATTSALAPSR